MYLCVIMKRDKQELFLDIMSYGRYKICDDGVFYSYRKHCDSFEVIRPNVLPSGYRQYVLYGPRGSGKRVIVYGHVAVWLFFNGIYSEGMVINHKDLDKGNNALSNLECLSVKDNVIHSYSSQDVKKGGSYCSLIRYEEIEKIRQVLSDHPGWSKAMVARHLGLNRIPVTRIINKILRGEPLKYGSPGKVVSPNSKFKLESF